MTGGGGSGEIVHHVIQNQRVPVEQEQHKAQKHGQQKAHFLSWGPYPSQPITHLLALLALGGLELFQVGHILLQTLHNVCRTLLGLPKGERHGGTKKWDAGGLAKAGYYLGITQTKMRW